MQGAQKKRSIDISMIVIVIIIGCLIYAGYLFFLEDDPEFTHSDEVLANLSVACEAGGWVTFPIDKKVSRKFTNDIEFSGVVVDAGMENDELTDEGGDSIITTHPEYSLIFYAGRRVEIEGSEIESDDKKNIYAHKIRCFGDEAMEEIKMNRRNLMNHIDFYAQEIFAKSSFDGHSEIEEISFVNDEIVYVLFTQDLEEETDVVLLMKFEKSGDGYIEEVLAQYEYDDEGRVLSAGKNDYSGQSSTSYEYDKKSGEWVLAW